VIIRQLNERRRLYKRAPRYQRHFFPAIDYTGRIRQAIISHPHARVALPQSQAFSEQVVSNETFINYALPLVHTGYDWRIWTYPPRHRVHYDLSGIGPAVGERLEVLRVVGRGVLQKWYGIVSDIDAAFIALIVDGINVFEFGIEWLINYGHTTVAEENCKIIWYDTTLDKARFYWTPKMLFHSYVRLFAIAGTIPWSFEEGAIDVDLHDTPQLDRVIEEALG